jgi:hypothetical protein
VREKNPGYRAAYLARLATPNRPVPDFSALPLQLRHLLDFAKNTLAVNLTPMNIEGWTIDAKGNNIFAEPQLLILYGAVNANSRSSS